MTDEDLIVESNYLLPKVASQYGFEFSEFETYNQLKYMFLSLVNSFYNFPKKLLSIFFRASETIYLCKFSMAYKF